MLEAFKSILEDSGEKPRKMVSDKGAEFGGVFKDYLEEQGIKYSVKDNLRQIATIDVAIGYLKKAMVRDARKQQTDDWADRLDKVGTEPDLMGCKRLTAD